MGQRPLRIAEYDDYLRVLSALLRGEVVDYTFNGVTRPITMLMHERESMNWSHGSRSTSPASVRAPWSWPASTATASSSPSHRAGAGGRGPGPRASRRGARRSRADRVPHLRAHERRPLEPGERIDSERIVRTVGPNVMASVYYFYDEVHERGIEPPPFLRPIWKRYCASSRRRRPSTVTSAPTSSTTRACTPARPS